MTDMPSNNHYLNALRDDLPTPSDEARLRRRLTAVGLSVVSTAVTQGAAAAVSSVKPAGLLASLSHTFASLPLLSQVGLVTAATALFATGPAYVVANATLSPQQAITVAAPRSLAHPAVKPSHRPTVDAPQNALLSAPVQPTTTSDEPIAIAASLPQVRTRQPSAPLVEPGSTLAEETALIDAAFSAIRARKFEQAAQFLRTHAQRFPKGKLHLERERASQKLDEAKRRITP